MSETNERVILKRGKSATIPEAKEAGSILIETDTGTAYVDNTNTERVQLKDPSKLSLTGGTMEGPIDMGDNSITVNGEPTEDTDLVNKEYVDNRTIPYVGIEPIEINDDEISHFEYGAMYGGPIDDEVLDYNSEFVVPRMESDETGHVIDISTKKMTMPDIPPSVEHANNADIADQLSTPHSIDGALFDGTEDVNHYGVCSTASGTQIKVVTCDGFKLLTGSLVYVQFENTNLADDPMLNVNGTGAKYITFADDTISTFEFVKNAVYAFVYNGETYETILDSATQLYGAKTAGPVANITINPGDTFIVPYFETDDYGNVVETIDRELKLSEDASGGGGGTGGTSYYGTCITGSNITSKIVVCDNFELSSGVTINVLFSYRNLASNPTLNINATGAVPITYQGSRIDADAIVADTTYLFAYTGTSYEMVSTPMHRVDYVEDDQTEFRNITILDTDESVTDVDAPNGTVILKKQAASTCRVYWGTSTTSGSTSTKSVVSDGFEFADGATIHVLFSNTNTASSIQLNINSTGAYDVYFQGSLADADAIVGNTTYTFVFHDGIFELIGGGASSADMNTVVDAINDIYEKLENLISTEEE